MPQGFEGCALVYCQGAFRTTNGKTAHGLVRRSERYQLAGVIDSQCAGSDAGQVLDGASCDLPIYASLLEAIEGAEDRGLRPTHLVVGLAPDGGRLPSGARDDLLKALRAGLHLVSGLHDYLGDDAELAELAAARGRQIIDIRRPPAVNELHFFSGKIDHVDALRIAVLGTDSAVGKRTTAWMLVDALRADGHPTELVGTGQTAWLQGARFGVIMDCLINDFVSGEIEHAVWSAWHETRPEVLIIEGQGSLLNPAYPGGFEILAAARPDLIVLQHAPGRTTYDGFPDHPLDPLARQIEAVELIGRRPVVAITLNHEAMTSDELALTAAEIRAQTNRPTLDVLWQGTAGLLDVLRPHLASRRGVA